MTMTGPEFASILTSLATLVTAVGAFIVGLRNTRKLDEVHTIANSLADKRVAEAKDASFAQGVKSETDKHGSSHDTIP